MPDPTPPRAWPYAVAVALVGAVLASGALHRFEDADGLIPVFVSLEKWTPFYWGQARFGMLVPLLAMPVRAPLANLVVQMSLDATLALAAFFLLARYLTRRPSWPLAGGVAAALALLTLPAHLAFQLFSTQQPYGVSLALGLAGLIALEPTDRVSPLRLLLALVLTALATWVNASLAVVLLPLVGFRQLLVTWPEEGLRRALRRLATEAGVQLAAMAASIALLRNMNDGNPYFGIQPSSQWPRAVEGLLGALQHENAGSALPLVVLTLALGGLGLQAWPRLRPSRRETLGAVAALAICAGLLVGLTSVNVWVMKNLYAPRYVLPSVMMSLVAVGLLCDAALGQLRIRTQAWPVLLGALLLALSVGRFGAPSMTEVSADIARLAPPVADQVVANGCTHLIGDYWRSWPLAFQADELLRNRGEDRHVWAVSTRSEAIRDLWKAGPISSWVLCAPELDRGPAEYVSRAERLPPLPFSRVGNLVIARGAAASTP